MFIVQKFEQLNFTSLWLQPIQKLVQLKWALLPVHEWWPISGAHGWGQWHSQYEARGNKCLLLNFLIDNDFTSCSVVLQAWTTKWSKFQPITTKLFSFSENVLKLSGGNILPGPQFQWEGGEWKVCFYSQIIYWNSYSNEKFAHFSGVRNTPNPRFRGGWERERGLGIKFDFVSGNTSGPPFHGRDRGGEVAGGAYTNCFVPHQPKSEVGAVELLLPFGSFINWISAQLIVQVLILHLYCPDCIQWLPFEIPADVPEPGCRNWNFILCSRNKRIPISILSLARSKNRFFQQSISITRSSNLIFVHLTNSRNLHICLPFCRFSI